MPGPSLPVHTGFDGGEQLGHALNFVEHDFGGQSVDETHWVGFSRGAQRAVIKRVIDIALPLAHMPGEGGLPALARTMHQHDGRVGQGIEQAGLDPARMEKCGEHAG
ncbi:MAG: hypothetical protein BWZ08_02420 [candidate division BRC1 bacterium ADurb.BinA292]|nr:MAG: hypothetical protein BWZ08_02420 [candidate division BRC1 bacterium ADurb.BinA292]